MTQPHRIHYTKPSITERELHLVSEAAEDGWGEQCYAFLDRFERQFAAYLPRRYAIATSSATGALHIGMKALGIGPGDEVIIGELNWIASAAPICYLGASPVLVDVLPDTWCLDPAAVAAAITPRTRAIVAVHLYGNPCELDVLQELCDIHGIELIEDAAEAIGSTWHGRRAGCFGRFSVFSFHGTKTMTTGEGGMLVTDDPMFHEAAVTLANHGRARDETRQFWPSRIGFKYKMSNLQAALGCAQLERIEDLVARKREIFFSYQEHLKDLPLRMNPEFEHVHNSFWLPTIVVDEAVTFDRNSLITAMREDHIDARVMFWPLSSLPMFSDTASAPTLARAISSRGLNLPSYHDMTAADIGRVAGHVRRALR